MSGKVCSNSFSVAAYLQMLRMLGTQDSGGVHPDVSIGFSEVGCIFGNAHCTNRQHMADL